MLTTNFQYERQTVKVVLEEEGIMWVVTGVLKSLGFDDFRTALKENVLQGDLKNILFEEGFKTCISTAGVFGLIYKVNTEEAYAFKAWLEKHVLPKYLANQYFMVSSLNPGLAKVFEKSLTNIKKSGYVSVEEYLAQQRIILSRGDLKALEKRVAQYYRVGKQEEPQRRGSITVYPRTAEGYLEAALSTVM